ncbi:hypothetical protein BDZ89DRAFT_894711, partial [Hymenopellis radicata]
STSNLIRHMNACKPDPTPGTQTKLTATMSKYTKGGLRFRLAKWVTRRHRPDAIVEDDELIEIFEYLNPKVETPSAKTTRRDI